MPMDHSRVLLPSRAVAAALRTIHIEQQALATLLRDYSAPSRAATFASVVDLIIATSGRIVVTGMGKSGLVGRKIAATFASTGTPSLFIHPAEASHGDLGMIGRDDVVLAISWSGETSELSDILNYCARFAIPLVAITSRPVSALGKQANFCLTLPEVQEACPNDLAPTSTTTIQATMGDALAVAASEMRRFSPEDFLVFHPKGQLGARLVKVADIMGSGETLPQVNLDATIADATLEMSAKRFGITAIVDAAGSLVGAFSDGDLRRSLSIGRMVDPVREYMTQQPLTVSPDVLASEALAIMNRHNILQLFICDADRLVGIVHLHDVLRTGLA